MTEQRPTLNIEDGFFSLGGLPPAWIWGRNCSDPGCECREALVLASTESPGALLARAAAVHRAWAAGEDFSAVADSLAWNGHAFMFNIDSCEAFPPRGGMPLVLEEHPDLREIAERIDGEILDELGRLWYRGKGLKGAVPRSPTSRAFEDWRPGVMIPWDHVFDDPRQDVYLIGDAAFEAFEHYCVTPGCDCGNVMVDFNESSRLGLIPVGGVTVHRSGSFELEATDDPELVDRLWLMFQRRHPRHLARFARRSVAMQEFGAELVVVREAAASSKVGRNDPCPCGSGKKHKKCCGAGATPHEGA